VTGPALAAAGIGAIAFVAWAVLSALQRSGERVALLIVVATSTPLYVIRLFPQILWIVWPGQEKGATAPPFELDPASLAAALALVGLVALDVGLRPNVQPPTPVSETR
jgi:hypothetical protein